MKLSDEELTRRLEAYEQAGSYKAAAEQLGIDEASVRRSVRQATRRNVGGDFEGGILPPGYTMGKVTTLKGPNGTVMEWQHKLPDADRLEDMVDKLIEALKEGITPLPEVDGPTDYRSELLTVYPIVDVHLGQYSWAKETGENYDTAIARDQFLNSTSALMTMTPSAETALIVVLGDFFHADNNNAQTERSKHHLDVDSRHDQVLHIGIELIIWQIDRALQKHHKVLVKVMRGNHDPNASRILTAALWFRYEHNSRVEVKREPVDLWSYEFGLNMLSFTHGDNVKAEDMPGVMAAFEADMWGRTKYRFGYSGHFHRQKKGPLSDEKHGAIWEILPAFTAKDAWNKSMGFSGHRSMQAITFHKEEGRKYINFVDIK